MAGVELATAYVNIVPGTSDIKGYVKKLVGEYTTETQKEQQKQKRRFSDWFKAGVGGAVGGFVGGMVTNAVGKLRAGVSEMVNSFSDLEDATGAASVVFGENFMGPITKQAETAAATMGMTKAQVIDAANTFGTFGKAAGLSGNELTGFSTRMTQLAGDLSSFKGGSPEEAIQAIGAALRGESEPIRRYGVLLDDATLKNRALKMGLISSTKDALTPQVKTLAAQAEILAQTKDATGDFERTQNSTANTAKRFTATMINFKTTLGGAVAPAFTLVKGVAADAFGALDGKIQALTPKITAFWEGFTGKARGALKLMVTGNFTAGIGKMMGLEEDSAAVGVFLKIHDAIARVGTAAKTVLGGIGGFFRSMGGGAFSAAQSILQIVGAFSPVKLIFQALEPVLPTLASALSGIGAQLGGVLSAIAPQLGAIANLITGLLNQLLGGLAPVITQILNAVLPVLPALIQLAGQLIAAVLPIISQLAQPLLQIILLLLPPITQLVTFVISAITPVLPVVVQLVGAVIAAIGGVINILRPILPAILSLINIALIPLMAVVRSLLPVVSIVFNSASGIIKAALSIITGAINVFAGILTGDWGRVWSGIKQIVSGVWNGIKALISGALNIVKTIIGNALNFIRSIWSAAWNWVSGFVGNAFNKVKSGISSGIGHAVNTVKELPGRILSALGNLGSLLLDAGKSVIQGFIDGITAMWDTVKNKLSSLTDMLPDWKGPADKDKRILYNAGVLVIGGFNDGLQSQFSAVKSTLAAFTSELQTDATASVEIGARIAPPPAFSQQVAAQEHARAFSAGRVVINQNIAVAEVPKASRLASEAADKARLLGVI